MSKSGYEEVAAVLPERDRDGTYFWQRFAERVQHRFEGVPATDGKGSFVDECLRAGAEAVPVMRSNTLWVKNAPDSSNQQARDIYELQIRLGLFYAASLRCLVHGVSRLRMTCGKDAWHGVTEEGQPFSEFAAGREDEVEVTWTNAAPSFGEVCLVTQVFVPVEELLLLSPSLAAEVYRNLGPDSPAGLFGMMLAAEGQAERAGVDVAGVFLEALARAVHEKDVLQVNSKANGHVFITPDFWLLTCPVGLGEVLKMLRTRRVGRRHNFNRHEVFRALLVEGHLVGTYDGDGGNSVKVYAVDVIGWDKPIELYGLAIAATSVPVQASGPQVFDGTVIYRREVENGNAKGQ